MRNKKTIVLFKMTKLEKTKFISVLDKIKRDFSVKHLHINTSTLSYYRFMLMQLSRACEMDEKPDYCVKLV